MKVVYRRHGADWRKKLLCVTHTERPLDRERCGLNFLEKRYQRRNRLPPTRPFAELPPVYHHAHYGGDATVWEFVQGDFGRPRLLAHLSPTEPGHKLQHVLWHRRRLWILTIDRLDVFDADLSLIAQVRDPWMADAHTVFPDHDGRLLVACTASDSVLVVDTKTYEVSRALRLPEALYGANYPLSRSDSVVDHFLPNDLQLAHLNCAGPWRGGIVVSTLIPGAIGWFDPAGRYQELLRGLVGSHGVRADTRTGQLYFCDSTLGVLVFLGPEQQIQARVSAASAWLHDAQQLDGELFALSVADRNQVELTLTSTREVLAVIPGQDFGRCTKFLSYGE